MRDTLQLFWEGVLSVTSSSGSSERGLPEALGTEVVIVKFNNINSNEKNRDNYSTEVMRTTQMAKSSVPQFLKGEPFTKKFTV